MDARIDTFSAFGMNLGDAHIIRNAGGSAKEALRSIIISEQLLGTNEIVLVKHTGCGMLTFQNADARAVVEKNLGTQAASDVASLDFLPFSDLDTAVREDIEFLRSNRAIAESIAISGWVYDVKTGKARQVV